MNTPIAIFAYNRLDNLEMMMESLKRCSNVAEHDCYIFSDNYNYKKIYDKEKVSAVRTYLKRIKDERIFRKTELVFADFHKGCEKSVIDGMNYVLSKYDSVIDIEDDILLSTNFLNYMDDALDFFRENKDVGSITGFSYGFIPSGHKQGTLYKAHRSCSWAFGTWADRWNGVDWNITDYDKILDDKSISASFSVYGYDLPEMLRMQVETCLDTWDIQWCYSLFKRNYYTVYPAENFAYNIGYDGTHMKNAVIKQTRIDLEFKKYELSNCNYNYELDNFLRELNTTKAQYDNQISIIDDKMWRYYRILDCWMTYRSKGINLFDYFSRKGYSKLAIYGAGSLARHLMEEYRDSEVDIKYVIDLHSNIHQFYGIPVFGGEDDWKNVDAIIVTPVMEYRKIYNFLEKRMKGAEIISLERLILC